MTASPRRALNTRDRYGGALLGLAAGDALGTTLEFCSPGTFTPLVDIVGGGPFSLEPGQWTDDTSMALCLAESLIECHGFDAADQMRRYVRWYRRAHLSSNGRCFDIGIGTRDALELFERTGDPWSGVAFPDSGGNGSLMRLAPVPLAFAAEPALAIRRAADSSCTTHGAREAADACAVFAALLLGALDGMTKATLLSAGWASEALVTYGPLDPAIATVIGGSYRHREPPAIRGGGYVVHALEAALWAVHGAKGFRDAVLRAANLGDDADTTAAIAGQLAGALWGVGGEHGVPEKWVAILALRDTIERFADGLCDLAQRDGTAPSRL